VNFGPRSILLIIAVVLFLLAAFGVGLGDIGITALGFAVFAAAFLFDNGRDGGRDNTLFRR
jgi:membrane-bound ClpP family serine protease